MGRVQNGIIYIMHPELLRGAFFFVAFVAAKRQQNKEIDE